MYFSSFHPNFCTLEGISSLWGETIKVTAGRELAQAYTALCSGSSAGGGSAAKGLD